MKLWKVLVVIILIEVAFFSGAILREGGITKKKETEYVPVTKEVPKKIYINGSGAEMEMESKVVHGIGAYSDNESGEIVNFTVTMIPNSGEILIEVGENTYGTDFQISLRHAREAVKLVSGDPLSKKSFSIYSSSPGILKGSSGSLAAGLGIYALVEDKEVRKDTAAVGVLHEDGDVSSVALLGRKMKVAEEDPKIKKVLVPSSQCGEVQSETVNITCVNNIGEAFNILTS